MQIEDPVGEAAVASAVAPSPVSGWSVDPGAHSLPEVSEAVPASAAITGYSWSTQPERRSERLLTARGRIAILVAAVAVGILVTVIAVVRPHLQGSAGPDLRKFLLPIPADAAPCPQDDSAISAAQLARTDSLSAADSALVSNMGLTDAALRCWLSLESPTVEITLLRFDSDVDAERALSPAAMASLRKAGAADFVPVPAVPGARLFTMPAAAGGTGSDLWVVGEAAKIVFVVTATASPLFDQATAESLAQQQYQRL